MAGTKVFISSTCYDLSVLRAELRNFILSLGHEPIMSECADVVYDPRIHTHTSCVNEVINCDIMIVIIGSRFGGKSVPEAISKVDLAELERSSKDSTTISKKSNISITQLEVLKALENNIPVYTFVEKKVYYEHDVYEKNKNNPEVIKNMIFPAIEKQESAPYIFDFLNFIRLKSAGNYFFQFERLQDIEEILMKQWSGYFQRLLSEQRHQNEESKQIDRLNEQFEDLKTAILTSIDNLDQREIANGIVRYRRLIDILLGLKFTQNTLCNSNCNFMELLKEQDIMDILDFNEISPEFNRHYTVIKSFLLKSDMTFYECRIPKEMVFDLSNDWDSFKAIKKRSKEIIIETLQQLHRPTILVRHRVENFDEYIRRIRNREISKGFSSEE